MTYLLAKCELSMLVLTLWPLSWLWTYFVGRSWECLSFWAQKLRVSSGVFSNETLPID